MPSLIELAHKVLDDRYEKGMMEYGKPLTPFNGRDALQDAIEEAADLLMYLLQAKQERDTLHPKKDI